MTTLNIIIEEEKKQAKQKWEETVTFCRKRKDGPSVLMHENFLDVILTTAMQRAYEAGQRESLAKCREYCAVSVWNHWAKNKFPLETSERTKAFGEAVTVIRSLDLDQLKKEIKG